MPYGAVPLVGAEHIALGAFGPPAGQHGVGVRTERHLAAAATPGQLKPDDAAGAVDPVPRQAQRLAFADTGEQRELDMIGKRRVPTLSGSRGTEGHIKARPASESISNTQSVPPACRWRAVVTPPATSSAAVLSSPGHRRGGMPEKGALLAVLIVERPLCVACISEKSAIPSDEIEPLLARIATRIAMTSAVERCRACGETKKVYVSFRAE